MVISSKQLAAFEDAATKDFVNRGVAYLRKNHSSEAAALNDQALNTLIRNSILRAKEFGLETEREVIAFSLVTLLLGADFLDNPAHLWARQLLKRKGWTAEQRAQYLLETVPLVKR